MSSSFLPALDAFLRKSLSNHPEQAHLAIFDCDGTVIQGDIGEAMFFRQVQEFQFRTSPANVWPDHPKPDELNNLYESLSSLPQQKRALDRRFVPFTQMLLSWYFDQLADGETAKACGDIVGLLAGFSQREARVLARTALRAELDAPVGKRQIGKFTLPLGVRYIQETLDAIARLKNLGFEVWAISGSNQWAVEAVFEHAGIPHERVIGISLLESEGVLSSQVKRPIPVLEGKIDAIKERTLQIPLLVFSDSTFDMPLFGYASEMKVLINSRHESSEHFFSSGGGTRDSSWIVLERPTLVMNG